MLIVDAEDMFTGMLGHQTRSLGLDATIRSWDAVPPENLDGYDCVVLGPGPATPGPPTDPKVRGLADLIGRLFAGASRSSANASATRCCARCWGSNSSPGSGPTRAPSAVSTSSDGPSRSASQFLRRPPHRRPARFPTRPRPVELCRDPATGEVHAVRGERFAATQFHLESVLTEHGTDLLADLLGWALRHPAELIECEAER